MNYLPQASENPKIISIFVKFCEATSKHSSVHWCLALKGQRHQIFCFRYFHELSSPSLWKSENLLHLWTFCMRGNLRICGPNIFCNLRIWDLLTQIYCGPTTSTNLKILFLSVYQKCSNSNFYQIKNSASQTCSWLLDSFAIFLKRFLILSVLQWKLCRFAICGF